MEIWAVMTQKGGSGKSTIAIHLAIAADSHGKKTTVVDVDPQQSSVRWSRIRNSASPAVTHAVIPTLTQTLAATERQGSELAIIDTSPRADRDCIEVAKLAGLIIVPVKPSILDLPAVEDTLRLIHMAGALARTVIVLNAVPARTDEGKEATGLLTALGPLLPQRLGERVDFRRALIAGKGVTEFAPSSKASEEVEALYVALESRSAKLAAAS